MIDDEPQPAQYYDKHDIWTFDPTSADKDVYEAFAADVVKLVQLLDENEPLMSRDFYARLFASLLDLSRVMGEYENGWSQGSLSPGEM
ncbi:MAG: hypothetical protein AB3N07_01980 [Ruegeria sp.]|uniref:hypothetical protein n=1 Tax=Ruegeria sp. ANG-S4 TaxID=1577904 RepID=UPI00057D862B|nr:hypothetical protein [Ruegeria sp. ANG-S4]KIC45215.1 hypothetical protein RA28_12125 [Ruegeria sp. ANG-S4]